VGIGGSIIGSFNMVIFRETAASIWMLGDENNKRENLIATTITAC
jgi:hypothetical protein